MDERRVVHETIDGESIVIDLGTGNYYSLAGPGSDIWTMLAAGCAQDYVVAELERVHEGEGDEIRSAVDALVAEIIAAGLLEPSGHTAATSAAAAMGHEPLTPGRGPFQPPALETYTDMQYYLLLDPIHEVGEAGWPHEQRAATGDGAA